MIQVYKLLDNIKDHFYANGITNKVSYGNEFELDLDKTTMFPLVHLDIIEANYDGPTVVFKMLVMCLDVVNISKTPEAIDEFFGGADLHDVLNSQFVVLTKFINSTRRGDLFEEKIELVGEPRAEPYTNKLGNLLAGWGAEVELRLINDISGC